MKNFFKILQNRLPITIMVYMKLQFITPISMAEFKWFHIGRNEFFFYKNHLIYFLKNKKDTMRLYYGF
ncbi:MAG TPA: hypothetical protein DIW31_06985 [Bacteroidales bacterium]|nr:hypothetical protein [Bacteroidales bacterium]